MNGGGSDSDDDAFYDPPKEADVSEREETPFDPSVVSQHTYLGDVDELQCEQQLLEDGRDYTMPFLSPSGTVTFPGMVVPLKAFEAFELASLEKALTAPVPLRGMVVLEPFIVTGEDVRRVGCLAMIRQVGRDAQGTLQSIVAQGRQRVNILAAMTQFDPASRSVLRLARVRMLPQETVPRLERQLQEGYGHWAPWAVRLMDPYFLAQVAYSRASEVLSDVKDLTGDPVMFSYWLASSLPIDCASQQLLLMEDSVVYRLRKELLLLSDVFGIFCRACRERLANVSDIVAMSETGRSDVFVNAHGYTHDLLTLTHVDRIKLQGEPTAEHSWFPGYAWTLAHCPTCLSHLGWRFTAAERQLQPHCFWAFTRIQITHKAQRGAARL